MQGQPHQRKEKQHGEEEEDEEQLALEGAQVLLFLFIGSGLQLDLRELGGEVRRNLAGGVESKSSSAAGRHRSGEEELAIGGPELGDAEKFLLETRHSMNAGTELKTVDGTVELDGPECVGFVTRRLQRGRGASARGDALQAREF